MDLEQVFDAPLTEPRELTPAEAGRLWQCLAEQEAAARREQEAAELAFRLAQAACDAGECDDQCQLCADDWDWCNTR